MLRQFREPLTLILLGAALLSGIVADLAQNYIRPLLQKNVPGTIGTPPFGPNARSILVQVNPDKLRSYNLSPQDVVKAIQRGNVVIPAGNIYVQDRMPLVPTNAMVGKISELGSIPVKLDTNVYIRDIATIIDSRGVAVRAGHHCAQPLMERCNVAATARASFAMYNRIEDVDALVDALNTVKDIFG